MHLLAYRKDKSIMNSEIIYAYEFNTEYIQSKNEENKDLICFIVKEEGEKDFIEYYLNRNTNPDEIIWHNRFLAGTSFEKRLKSTSKGECFSYRKKQYLYKVLEDDNIKHIINGKVFNSIV